MVKILHIHLDGEFWRDIRDEKKGWEFREISDYWKKMLVNKTYDMIKLYLGYPKATDTSRIILRKWKGYRRRSLTHKKFGPEKVKVFAIDVREKV